MITALLRCMAGPSYVAVDIQDQLSAGCRREAMCGAILSSWLVHILTLLALSSAASQEIMIFCHSRASRTYASVIMTPSCVVCILRRSFVD